MIREIRHLVDASDDGKSVLELLKRKLCVSSRLLPELKRQGGILMDGKNVTVREKVAVGQSLVIVIAEEKPSENVVPVDLPIHVIYEDEDILAVSKPKDMPIHPSAYNYDNTLGNAVMYYYRGENFVFRPITRLDRDTTGIVLVAKNKLSATVMSEDMKEGRIKKSYLALLSRCPEKDRGRVDAPIARCPDSVIKRMVDDDGKEAVTEYEIIEKRADESVVALVRPITGRTHQIRVHMAHIGCPLKYDYLYGKEIAGKTLFLHCTEVSFPHPVTRQQVRIKCPPFCDSELLSQHLS